MRQLLLKYKAFLETSGERYRHAARKHNIRCRKGCHECCATGYFDITLLDALYLHEVLKHIPARTRERITAKANEQLDLLEKRKAFSRKDPLLRSVPAIITLSRKSSDMSCPCLDENGKCMIYKDRLHICRIFGPTIRGAYRKVWLKGCRYFKVEIPEEDVVMADEYVEETNMKRELFLKAGHKHIHDVDTIIPAAVALDLRKFI